MLRWVVRSILHGEPIELFLVPASAPRVIKHLVLAMAWNRTKAMIRVNLSVG